MLELGKTMPSIVPRPWAHRRCQGAEASYFVSDYVEIDHRPPDAAKLGAKIAELHRVSKSPTGQFGFHVTPYDENFLWLLIGTRRGCRSSESS